MVYTTLERSKFVNLLKILDPSPHHALKMCADLTRHPVHRKLPELKFH